jgi:hypothetical protein
VPHVAEHQAEALREGVGLEERLALLQIEAHEGGQDVEDLEPVLRACRQLGEADLGLGLGERDGPVAQLPHLPLEGLHLGARIQRHGGHRAPGRE